MRLKNIYRLLPFLLVIAAVAVIAISCGGDDSENMPAANAYLSSTTVNCETTSVKLQTEGSSKLKYTASITEGTEWGCSFMLSKEQAETTGQVGSASFVYFPRNTGSAERYATFHIEYSDGAVFDLRLKQSGYSVSATYDHEWAELPKYRTDPDYIYKTYYSTLTVNSRERRVRNYTVCYDTERRISQWVAYPIHDIYLKPSLTRKDCFGYDPNDQLPAIPRDRQQDITRGYGTGRHDRGHMLPNASRMNNYDINAMTFYATNMMPQNSALNQNTWASLEGKVREARSANSVSDTLYVVVGTYFGDNDYITDRSGNRIAEPSHCYKLLLRAKKHIPEGKTMADLTADEIMAVGFWFENSTAGNNTSLADAAVSIEYVEQKTGFEFFQMLGDEAARQVKSRCDLKEWGRIFD